jgi:hypothetical protein
MVQEILFYFELGWRHILSIDATDHLLFLLTLTCIYFKEKKSAILILITAFTIGHTTTLILSTFDLIKIKSQWVEFLIALTIVFSALNSLLSLGSLKKSMIINYCIAAGFGLIHGLGFAKTIKMMLASEQTIFVPLLFFNIGLELAQIVVISILLLISILMFRLFKVEERNWTIMILVISLILGLRWCFIRWPV